MDIKTNASITCTAGSISGSISVLMSDVKPTKSAWQAYDEAPEGESKAALSSIEPKLTAFAETKKKEYEKLINDLMVGLAAELVAGYDSLINDAINGDS